MHCLTESVANEHVIRYRKIINNWCQLARNDPSIKLTPVFVSPSNVQVSVLQEPWAPEQFMREEVSLVAYGWHSLPSMHFDSDVSSNSLQSLALSILTECVWFLSMNKFNFKAHENGRILLRPDDILDSLVALVEILQETILWDKSNEISSYSVIYQCRRYVALPSAAHRIVSVHAHGCQRCSFIVVLERNPYYHNNYHKHFYIQRESCASCVRMSWSVPISLS